MQPGRKPLESHDEYVSRMQDYLKNIRMSVARIVVCTARLEETMKVLEIEYNLDFPEWKAVFANLDIIGEKTTNFVEDFIRARE